jgi:8-oxo-dGTP pyrophosphatase MutT (NUDIX family)
MPEVDATRPPGEWILSSDGINAAAALRLEALAASAVSSPERKAVQTVALALRLPESAVATAVSFREVDRVESVHDGFRDARRAWIAGRLDERHEGWETPDAAARRFHEALLAQDARHVVVGTHGMVLTAWLASQGLVADAVAFWEALRFPDVVEIGIPLLRVRAVLTDADGRFVLIKRTRPGQEPYWTTPGGGVMLDDASADDALRRELHEELGAEVELGEVVLERQLDSIHSEVFYAARLTSIDPTLADGPEFDDPSRGAYEVEVVTLDELRTLDLRPSELKELLLAQR